MDWIKVIANVTGLADFWSKYFGKRQDQQTGAALQKGKDDEQTLDHIIDINRPVGTDELNQLWDKNITKFDRAKRNR